MPWHASRVVGYPLHGVDSKDWNWAIRAGGKELSLDSLPSPSIPILFHCLAHVFMGRGVRSQFLLHKLYPALHLRIVCGQDCSQTHNQRNLISWGFPRDNPFLDLNGLRSVKKKTKRTKGLLHHWVTLLRENKIKCRIVANPDWPLHRY